KELTSLNVAGCALFTRDQAHALAVAIGIECQDRDDVIRAIELRHTLTHEPPEVAIRVGRLVRLPRREPGIVLTLEQKSDHRDNQHHDTRAHDMATITTAIAHPSIGLRRRV